MSIEIIGQKKQKDTEARIAELEDQVTKILILLSAFKHAFNQLIEKKILEIPSEEIKEEKKD